MRRLRPGSTPSIRSRLALPTLPPAVGEPDLIARWDHGTGVAQAPFSVWNEATMKPPFTASAGSVVAVAV